MAQNWELSRVIKKLEEVRAQGFVSIPPGQYRNDDGVVGQVLERHFGLRENNLGVGDLGRFELKAMRERSATLTLCHKNPVSGASPQELFRRFSYERPSRREPGVMKRKLFTTVTGARANNLGLILLAAPEGNGFELYCHDEFIARWDLSEQLAKMDRLILAFARTQGQANSPQERFHFFQAFMLEGLNGMASLVEEGVVTLSLCIDQPLDGRRMPHDRGPHIRMPRTRLLRAYAKVEPLVC